jgi:hypothetical protein
MDRSKDKFEIECMNSELMRFDIDDITVEELERRLELTIASIVLEVPSCPSLRSCSTLTQCGVFDVCGAYM